MSGIDERIKELIGNMESRFGSEDLYVYLEKNISSKCLIGNRKKLIRDRARLVLRMWKNTSGRRVVENVPTMDEDGKLHHEWIQPRLMSLDEARTTVDQTAKIGERTCRKANALAHRFQEESGYQIPLPFPWLEDDEAAAGQ